jgi:hypothetical protein
MQSLTPASAGSAGFQGGGHTLERSGSFVRQVTATLTFLLRSSWLPLSARWLTI